MLARGLPERGVPAAGARLTARRQLGTRACGLLLPLTNAAALEEALDSGRAVLAEGTAQCQVHYAPLGAGCDTGVSWRATVRDGDQHALTLLVEVAASGGHSDSVRSVRVSEVEDAAGAAARVGAGAVPGLHGPLPRRRAGARARVARPPLRFDAPEGAPAVAVAVSKSDAVEGPAEVLADLGPDVVVLEELLAALDEREVVERVLREADELDDLHERVGVGEPVGARGGPVALEGLPAPEHGAALLLHLLQVRSCCPPIRRQICGEFS